MSDGTKIEWTEATWNPVTGCSVLSPGCTNCYAMKLAGTRLRHHASREGLTRETKAGPVWTGEVRFNEQWLDQPLRWKRPRMIFVCAHGDLFHESVPDEWIDRVFAVMALCPQHTFQVLTKRSARMREYLSSRKAHERIGEVIVTSPSLGALTRFEPELDWVREEDPARLAVWPLPNVWLGVSAEDQPRWDERVDDLRGTLAAVRWVSAEPLLGEIRDDFGMDGVDWIVAGGESGPGARPMHPDWARSLRDQCAAAGVPFFFKQWGAFRPCTEAELKTACGATFVGDDRYNPSSLMMRASKGQAGRELDGQLHDWFPARGST